MAETGIVFEAACKEHRQDPGHPERPERLDAVEKALEKLDGDRPRITARQARRDELGLVHTERHIDTIEQTCAEASMYPDPDTQMGPASWGAALYAAGGAIEACRAVHDGTCARAFCAVRPPGHHAEPHRAMGFCLFNNIAIAARWLQRECGVQKVAILDWDVHHGNGTQRAFYDDASIYYASMHQHPHYPGTGYPDERGKGNTNLNIQMAAFTDPERWITALESEILPELERFAPDFLLISAGFDAHRDDPLASQLLTEAHFAQMTRMVKHLANGRIVSILEGGYNLEALEASVVAHVEALAE